jgi:hypothetical protein
MQVGKSLGKQQLKITSTRVTSKGSETTVETDICGELTGPDGSDIGTHHGTYVFTATIGRPFVPYTYSGVSSLPSGYGTVFSGCGFARRSPDGSGKLLVRGTMCAVGSSDPNLQDLSQQQVIVEGTVDPRENTMIGEGFEWL